MYPYLILSYRSSLEAPFQKPSFSARQLLASDDEDEDVIPLALSFTHLPLYLLQIPPHAGHPWRPHLKSPPFPLINCWRVMTRMKTD